MTGRAHCGLIVHRHDPALGRPCAGPEHRGPVARPDDADAGRAAEVSQIPSRSSSCAVTASSSIATWSQHRTAERSGQAQRRALPRRFHVPAHAQGSRTAVSGALGAQALLARDGTQLSHQLGEGLSGGGICGDLRTGHLAPIRAIGVDEIQYGRGHQYLTLVYQIEST